MGDIVVTDSGSSHRDMREDDAGNERDDGDGDGGCRGDECLRFHNAIDFDGLVMLFCSKKTRKTIVTIMV